MGVSERYEWCCETCGEDFEIETFSEMFGTTAILVDGDSTIGVHDLHEAEPPDEDYVPPHDVRAEFDEAQSELLDLLTSMSDPFDGRPVPPTAALVRMVFSQLVAVLEAYLADRLHREVIDNPKAKLRLVQGADLLKKQTITLHQAIGDPGLAERRVTETIKSVLYHRFDDVEALYRSAFRSKAIFPSSENRTTLDDAIRRRHHCVHRNGRDMEGNLQPVSVDDATKISKAMTKLVDHIEQVIAGCREKDAKEETPPPTSGPHPAAAAVG